MPAPSSDPSPRSSDATTRALPEELIQRVCRLLPEFSFEYRHFSYEWRGPIGPNGLSSLVRYAPGHPALGGRGKLSVSIPQAWSTLAEAREIQVLLGRLVNAASLLEGFDEQSGRHP